MAGTARRVLRGLERCSLESGDDPRAEDDPLLATLTAAPIRSRIATGPDASRPWRPLGDRVESVGPPPAEGMPPPARFVREGAMSLHADVAVPANDRRRLERLARYVLRPPLAEDVAAPRGRTWATSVRGYGSLPWRVSIPRDQDRAAAACSSQASSPLGHTPSTTSSTATTASGTHAAGERVGALSQGSAKSTATTRR